MSRRLGLTLMYGAGTGAVSLPGSISIDEGTGTGRPAASITLDNDGLYQRSDDPPTDYNWLTPDGAGVGTPYEIRFSPSAGTVSTGTVNTWLPFPQTWTKTRVPLGYSEVVGTLEIRLASGGAALASCSLTLSYEVT